MTKYTSGPAFPQCSYNMKGGYDITGGMTLRVPLYTAPQPAPSTSPLTWQPIETAPQSESEPFLVFVPLDDVADGVVIQVSWFDGRMYPDAKDAAVNWDDAIQNATYWMPLPDAPAHGIGAKP